MPPTSEANGVRQILLLPGAGKACILCDGIVTFYSLPELSPAFGTKKVANCSWIGGVDSNRDVNAPDGQVVMMAVKNKIMLVKVGDDARGVKNIEFPGCVKASRRDTIACVADAHSYALLEVEHQQKIPLFPISSVEKDDNAQLGKVEELPSRGSPLPARTISLAHRGAGSGEARGHTKSASLGNFLGDLGKRQPSPRSGSRERSRLRSPDPTARLASPAPSASPKRSASHASSPTREPPGHATMDGDAKNEALQKPLPPPPPPPPPKPSAPLLRPHVASPSPTEFLLTTGTGQTEPGVGMFVNLDGDVVRGTIEFARYPEALVIDSTLNAGSQQSSVQPDGDGYVLAIMTRGHGSDAMRGIEAQRWDLGQGDGTRSKAWIDIPSEGVLATNVGIGQTVSNNEHAFSDVGQLLQMVRLRAPGETPLQSSEASPEASDPRTKSSLRRLEEEKELFETSDPNGGQRALPPDWETKRNKEEFTYAQNLGGASSSVVLWSQDQIWTVVKNPLILQLDAALQGAELDRNGRATFDRRVIVKVLGDMRDKEPRTPTEFLSLGYIRQKCSMMLFVDLLRGLKHGETPPESLLPQIENILLESGLDPRIILMHIPLLREEIFQGPEGVWVHRGLADMAEDCMTILGSEEQESNIELLLMIRRFLSTWQGKKGFGSIRDETFVFDSVDGALLHLLLHLDKILPRGSSAVSSVRAKLNNTVEHWNGNFEHAVELLERYGRLFVLSRLYQSKKHAKDVLRTWRRVIEGEEDSAGELTISSAEAQIRKYLVVIRDAQLVEEYGIYLAKINPGLAVQAFSDDSSRIKLDPAHVISLLKMNAPSAVQEYLEHLVFTKSMHQYADDLIGYYLDSVLSVLEGSDHARDSLSQSYSTYRALRPPKPTYLNFISENAPPDTWWQARLRLLQLLGGGGGHFASSTSPSTSLSYSIPTVLQRLSPFSDLLVSETIILSGLQGQHLEALRLLTHGLGDYDTAIRYCLFGGPSQASSIIDPSNLPSRSTQSELFSHLLTEFMLIEDISDRIERSSELLARFAAWFDIKDVLSRVPDDWSVDLLSDFLVRALRQLVHERNEASIVKSLSAAQNLSKQAELVDVCEKLGAQIEGVEDIGGGDDGGGDAVEETNIAAEVS